MNKDVTGVSTNGTLPYQYINTELEDVLEYNGMTWINIDRFKELQDQLKKYKYDEFGFHKYIDNQNRKIKNLEKRINKALEYLKLNKNVGINETDEFKDLMQFKTLETILGGNNEKDNKEY